MEFQRPRRFSMERFPPGDYDTWTKKETARAEAHARAFASEYIKDYDSWATCLRLGYETDQVKPVAKMYLNHWLVRSYIEQLEAKFDQAGIASRDRLLALVHRDASNFKKGANSNARVAAQKLYAAMIGEDTASKRVKHEAGSGPVGGVMVITGMSPEEWEAKAQESQRKLKEDVRK